MPILDESERNNLKFLLNISEKTLHDWSSKMDVEDLQYAEELLIFHIEEIKQKIHFIKIERKLKECEEHFETAENIFNHIKRFKN